MQSMYLDYTTDKSSPQQGQSATSSSSHFQSANSSTFSEGELIVVDENARTPEKKKNVKYGSGIIKLMSMIC